MIVKEFDDVQMPIRITRNCVHQVSTNKLHIPLQLTYPGVWQLDVTGGFSLSCLLLSSSLHADILQAITMIVIMLKNIDFLMVQFLLRCPKDYDCESFRVFYDFYKDNHKRFDDRCHSQAFQKTIQKIC